MTVNLLDSSGIFTGQSTTTDSSEFYDFDGLSDGDYRLEFILPAGFESFSPQDIGGDDTLDSDVDSSGRTGVYSLSAGLSDTSWDAGLIDTDLVVTDLRAVTETTVSGTVAGSLSNTFSSNDCLRRNHGASKRRQAAKSNKLSRA